MKLTIRRGIRPTNLDEHWKEVIIIIIIDQRRDDRSILSSVFEWVSVLVVKYCSSETDKKEKIKSEIQSTQVFCSVVASASSSGCS